MVTLNCQGCWPLKRLTGLGHLTVRHKWIGAFPFYDLSTETFLLYDWPRFIRTLHRNLYSSEPYIIAFMCMVYREYYLAEKRSPLSHYFTEPKKGHILAMVRYSRTCCCLSDYEAYTDSFHHVCPFWSLIRWGGLTDPRILHVINEERGLDIKSTQFYPGKVADNILWPRGWLDPKFETFLQDRMPFIRWFYNLYDSHNLATLRHFSKE